MERIRAGQFSFDAPEWARVSQAAKSIIEGTCAYMCFACILTYTLHACTCTLHVCTYTLHGCITIPFVYYLSRKCVQ